VKNVFGTGLAENGTEDGTETATDKSTARNNASGVAHAADVTWSWLPH